MPRKQAVLSQVGALESLSRGREQRCGRSLQIGERYVERIAGARRGQEAARDPALRLVQLVQLVRSGPGNECRDTDEQQAEPRAASYG